VVTSEATKAIGPILWRASLFECFLHVNETVWKIAANKLDVLEPDN